MTDLSSITSAASTVRSAATLRRAPISVDPGAAAQASRPNDSVTLSEHARFLDTLKNSDGVRSDVVERVRGELAAGTYDISDEKIDKVLDGLLRDMYA